MTELEKIEQRARDMWNEAKGGENSGKTLTHINWTINTLKLIERLAKEMRNGQ